MKTTIKLSLLSLVCVLLANCANAPKNELESKVLTLSLNDYNIGHKYAQCTKDANEGYFTSIQTCLTLKGVKL